jgi:hypothetical protein
LDSNIAYAVDGNTDGEFLNSSTTHTQKEQGAWWQVDLGSKKSIDQIIIYNRIDCCANRLSNYQVSISNKADFEFSISVAIYCIASNSVDAVWIYTGLCGRFSKR